MDALGYVTTLALISSAAALGEVSADMRSVVPPYLSVYTSWHSTAAFRNAQGSVRTREYGLALGLYRVERTNALLDIGVDYEYTNLTFTGVASRNRDVHRLQFPLRFTIDSGGRELRGYVAPGVATSSNVFKDFLNRGGGDDLTFAGKLEVGSAQAARPWFVGVAYDQSFGGPRLYPVAGVDTYPADNLRIRIAFPDSGAWLQKSDRHAFSARLFPYGHRWRVVSDDFRSDFDLRREEWRAQLTWSFAVAPFLTVELSAGQAFDRQLILTDRTGTRVDAAVDSESFAAIGFRVGGGGAAQQPKFPQHLRSRRAGT